MGLVPVVQQSEVSISFLREGPTLVVHLEYSKLTPFISVHISALIFR